MGRRSESADHIGMSRSAIVVVEPRPARADRLVSRLTTLGLADDVTVCRTGREAIDRILCTGHEPCDPAPSAILIDLDASIADGAEVARRLRSTDRTASIPIVLLTENASASLRAAAARLGAHLVPAATEGEDLSRLGETLGLVRAVAVA
jgi:CheY-like chemotaxis protein